MHTRVLTGITTTGIPHLGNYVGAIRPAIAASRRADTDAFYFMADYHALIKCQEPARIQRSRLEIAATWVACGLDPERVTFYRQSDVPEIPQLMWMLTCVTAKGLLNRAHAYKAAVEKNTAAAEDEDAGVTAGLYMYPVLMAADILAFNATQVPVGRDQVQHIEMARDIAQRFNHIYGGDFFTLPEASIDEDVATLPGLDGRKMSKSYDNTIPLFEGGAKRTRAAIMRIVTDSRAPGEPKDADASSLFAIYRAFAGHAAAQTFRVELEAGMGWGDAKQKLAQCVEDEIGPLRPRYAELMAHPDTLEDILEAGAAKARAVAQPHIARLRAAVGLTAKAAAKGASAKHKATKRAHVVTFRDDTGAFRFRLLAANDDELALSIPFADPRAAGQVSQRVLQADTLTTTVDADHTVALVLDGEAVAHTPSHADAAQGRAAAERINHELAATAEDA